jgi:short-subunit dehydrogenase
VIAVYYGYDYYVRRKNREACNVPGYYKGKTVLITGASSGIGKDLAIKYAKLGANLSIVARRKNLLEDLKETLIKCGAGSVITIEADVGVKELCKNMVTETVNKLGSLDILVLNAGKSHIELFEHVEDTEIYRDYMNVNFFSCVDITFYAREYLLKSDDPKIIVVSSVTGVTGVPYRTIYSPTKHALRGFFDSLRFEVGDKIQITIISPGYVLTEIHDKFLSQNKKERVPNKFITAEYAAELIVNAEQERVNERIIPFKQQLIFSLRPFVPYAIIKLIMKKEAVPFKTE